MPASRLSLCNNAAYACLCPAAIAVACHRACLSIRSDLSLKVTVLALTVASLDTSGSRPQGNSVCVCAGSPARKRLSTRKMASAPQTAPHSPRSTQNPRRPSTSNLIPWTPGGELPACLWKLSKSPAPPCRLHLLISTATCLQLRLTVLSVLFAVAQIDSFLPSMLKQ